ncbi:MAG: ATP synthase F1 subunit gamma [Deltaproteobacteria bacterium]|nr:ATP synthase F1 subunit gamma [Deltaproteobacteria bacterium]
MATLKQIRRRLASVKSTQKITRAMKLVAAAKLRRAQENMMRARPYARRIRDVIRDVAEHVDREAHPMLQVRPEKKALLVVITSDRGLCGAFNSNINRRAERYLKGGEGGHEEVGLALLGRKGRDYFRRRPQYTVRKEYMEVLSDPTSERAAAIGREVVAEFIDGGLDAVYLVYNEFKSAISQRVTVERLLPIVRDRDGDGDTDAADAAQAADGIEFAYEPGRGQVLEAMLPLYVNVRVYFAVLESLAAEMAARMTAMESATKNAGEMISRLTLQYNKARQATITKEMLEIVTGAEALKG